MTKFACFTSLLFLLTFFGVEALEPRVPNTLELKDGQVSEPARIQDVSWLAGAWFGEGLGGMSEEYWTEPAGGSMTGIYRLVKDGKTVFQELLVIMEHQNSLILKLKHFNADLTGWEEKDKTVDFPLVRAGMNEAYFDGLTYRKLEDGSLQVFLKLKKKNGDVVEEEFRFRRKS